MKKLLLIIFIQIFCSNFIICNTNINSVNIQNSSQNNNKDKLKKTLLVNLLQDPSFVTDSLTVAIGDKYQCPTTPLQVSFVNQELQLTSNVVVNDRTKRLSDRIGMQVRRFTNQYRASKGLPPLAWDQVLANVGRRHTIQMANGTKPFNHDGFQQRFEKYREKRPSTTIFGENLFFGSNIPRDQVARIAVDAWIRSPSHEANLRRNFNRIGVSAFKNSENVWYITQLFALVN